MVGVAASRRAPARAAAGRATTTASGGCGEQGSGGRRRQRQHIRRRDADATGFEVSATRPTTGAEAPSPPPPHPPAEAGEASRLFRYRRRWWCRRGEPAGEEEGGGAHRRAAAGRGLGDSRGGLGHSDWREHRRRGAGKRHTGRRCRLRRWRRHGRGGREAQQPPLEGRWRQRMAASAQWGVTAGKGSCGEEGEGGRLLRSWRRAVRRPPTAPTAGRGGAVVRAVGASRRRRWRVSGFAAVSLRG